jgi:ABC-type sugar transport system ATPase subunit
VGTPAEIYRQPETLFVARFFGNPPMNFLECQARSKSGLLEITCQEFTFSLRTPATQSQGSVPHTMTLGFRPEDVQLGKSTKDALAGTANVSMVEAMGAETFVHLEIATLKLLARTLGHIDIQSGSQIEFSIPTDKLHLFDSSTGKRIHTRQPS